MSFLSVVGAVLHCSLRCCAGHLFSWGVSLQVMLVSYRWEGDLTICTFAYVVVMSQGGGGGGVRGV
jgi:hypothetical protein